VQGQPELFYKLNKSTEKNVLEGLLLALRSLRAAGAQRILTLHDSYTEYTLPNSGEEDADASFEEWLKGVEKKGAGPLRLQLFSAHQVRLLPPRPKLYLCIVVCVVSSATFVNFV
jgi:hypothetical protein